MLALFIELAVLDAVVNDLRVDAARTQVGEHAAVVVILLRKNKNFRGCPHRRGTRLCRERNGVAQDKSHGLGEAQAAHLSKIIQRSTSADPMRPPAPQTVGYLEAVMRACMIAVSAVVDKLVRFISLQVGQQIRLAGLCNLLFVVSSTAWLSLHAFPSFQFLRKFFVRHHWI